MRREIICLLVLFSFLTILSSRTTLPVHGLANPGVEGASEKTCPVNSNSCTITISTTNSSDVVLVGVYLNNPANTTTISSVLDTSGLVYTARSTNVGMVGFTVYGIVAEYYATTIATLSSDTITVSLSASVSTWYIFTLGVSGTDLNSLFDQSNPQRGVQSTGQTCTGWPAISTTAPQTIIFGIVGTNGPGGATPLVDPGFNLVFSGPPINTEYQIVSNPQHALLVQFQTKPCFSNSAWGIIIDALCTGPQGCVQGGPTGPNPQGFRIVQGPGGAPIPPQLADQNVLGYVFLLSAAIGLSSIRVERKKKTERRLRLG